MSLQIFVEGRPGYKANEWPGHFYVDEALYEIETVPIRMYWPEFALFRVRTTDGKEYLLRYAKKENAWSLQSDFDGRELLTRPSIQLVAVDVASIRKAERELESCEFCHPDDVNVPFDYILAEVTGMHGMFDFMLTETARCPNCRQRLEEGTLVDLQDDDSSVPDECVPSPPLELTYHA